MKTIKYLCYYASPKDNPKRKFVLSATNKIDYICSSIKCHGYSVELVSASGSDVHEKGSKIKVSDNVVLKLFHSFGRRGKLRRVFSRWLLLTSLFFYMMFSTKKHETVIAYHSLGYSRLLWLLKKIKKWRLILEIEEIYSDVTGNDSTRKTENSLFRVADGYIFPTQLLDDTINTDRKPSVIIHGTYQVEDVREKCNFESDLLHKKKHLLYAGTFDPRKGGALAAAAAAAYLTSDYHIHILGFGNDEDKKHLQETIGEVAKLGKATVTLDGLLNGEEYIRFVQSCDVGLSTQMPDAAFNNTSFPSKVLSYLANGLRVVSVRIPALEVSAVGDLLYYYDGNDPKAIADAIMSIDWVSEYDSRKRVSELDQLFVDSIERLLKND